MGHHRFEEDNSNNMQKTSTVSVPAVPSANVQLRTPHCCCCVRVDYDRNPAYVFKAVINASSGALAASTSTNIVKLYSMAGPELTHVGDLQGHTGTISEVAFAIEDSPHLVHTSSVDGTVRGWDMRSGQQAECYRAQGHELHCFGAQGHAIAAGGQGEVLFWDRRTGNKAGVLEDTHMDDVTQVKFHHGSQCVISASLDGLVAVHDTRKPLTDDDAFVAAANVQNSVEELGMYGQQGERLWVRTGTETLHLWEWGRCASDTQAGGEMPFADFTEARVTASQAAAVAGGAAAAAFGGEEEGVGYLVGCHYDPASSQLMLVAGQEGAVGFWPLLEQVGPEGAMVGAGIAPPVMVLTGVHREVVRSVQCFGDGVTGPFCVTGGEDAQLCLWSMDPSVPAVGGAGVGAAGGQKAAAKGQQGGYGGAAGGQQHRAGGKSSGKAGGKPGGQFGRGGKTNRLAPY